MVARRKRDAAMATHWKIDEFDPSHEAWATYVERLEFYFIAKGIEDPEKKRAVLLTVSGPATYKLIWNLSAPKKPAEKPYDELVALVKSHYTSKPSVIVLRFQFHIRTQKPGERVATFVAELWQLSEFCEFGVSLEDMLRDRLVCGIASGSIQRRLLAEPDLTLQKAQNLAQAIESTDKNAKDLQGQRQPPMTAVNAVTCKRGPPRGTRARTDAGKSMGNPLLSRRREALTSKLSLQRRLWHSCKKRGHLARASVPLEENARHSCRSVR